MLMDLSQCLFLVYSFKVGLIGQKSLLALEPRRWNQKTTMIKSNRNSDVLVTKIEIVDEYDSHDSCEERNK